jgi:tetratricopeptide (TPR) repeat protein/O-antigen ligase
MTARLLEVGVEAGILATLLLSPIPFGSVLPWAQAGLEILVTVTVGLWIIRMMIGGQVAARVTPLLWPGVAMLVLTAAQVLVPTASVSTYATWESFRLLAAYLAFLVVLSAYLVTPERLVRLVSILVVWGCVQASWGLFNRALGREMVLWVAKESYLGRLVSTFVNANHQAMYFSMLMFLALGMVLRPSRRMTNPAQARPTTVASSLSGIGPVARIWFGGAAVVLGVSVVLTASRGAVAAALAGILVMGAMGLAGRIRSQVVVGLVAGLTLFVGYMAWLGADALVDRLAILAREPFGDLRWEIWRSTLRIGAEAPVLGTGLGTFVDAIVAHRPTGLTDAFYVEYAHNDYLQLFAETGTLGVLILAWAAAGWLTFVVARWRDRQDVFVRGLVMGGIGAVAAVAFHSTVEFGLHMPANAVLFIAILALLPAVVTLRAHRGGLQVDLREWRRRVMPRTRLVVTVVTVVVVGVFGVGLGSLAVADWKYQQASRLVNEKRQLQGALTMTDLAAAERGFRAAARLDRWNPRIQAEWATTAGELGHRVWTVAIAPDGTRLKPGTARDRLVASQEFFAAANGAFERSLRLEPLFALNHERYGWFLVRLDGVRRTVVAERLEDAVVPELVGTLTSPESLVPRAFEHAQEAVHMDPTSPARRLSLVSLALARSAEVPGARSVIIRESREAIHLDRRKSLTEIVRKLTAPGVEPDLLWLAVPRETGTLVELAAILEADGKVSAAAAALEDAVAMATDPADRVPVLLARARFALRRSDKALALGQARQALALAPRDVEVFAVLAEAYDANGMLDEAASAYGSALAGAGDLDVRRTNGYRAALASVLTRRGDQSGALILRRKAVEVMPNDPWAHLELARLLEARQEIAEGLREYESARVLGQGEWIVQASVAEAFVRHGLLREATAPSLRSVQLNPFADELRVRLGDLYARIGQPDRAKEQYHQVLARQPAHEGASRGLRAVMGQPSPG